MSKIYLVIIVLIILTFVMGISFIKISEIIYYDNKKEVSQTEENVINNKQVTVLTSIDNNEKETYYLVKEKDGYVIVYAIDEDGNQLLRQTTQIVTKYLPEIDKEKLKQGIKIKGREELNKLLEDYE